MTLICHLITFFTLNIWKFNLKFLGMNLQALANSENIVVTSLGDIISKL